MIDNGLFMMIYKPSKLIVQTVVCILIVYIILYGIIFHEYHYIRISVLTDPDGHKEIGINSKIHTRYMVRYTEVHTDGQM